MGRPRLSEASQGLPRHLYIDHCGGYYVKYRRNGLNRTVSLGTKHRGKACALADKMIRDFEGKPTKAAESFTRAMFYSTLRNAKTRKIENSLTHADVLAMMEATQGRCAVSGIPFDFAPGSTSRRPWIPSIDRIDSRQGYSTTNCRIVCLAVNIAMNEWGLEALERVTRFVAKANKRAQSSPDF